MSEIKSADQFFMGLALREAQHAAEAGEVPIGAVIVRDGQVIGRGRNSCEMLRDATAHAEMLALTAATNTIEDWRLEDCTCYVTCEPCSMCAGAMINARLGRLVYGTVEPKFGACGSQLNILGHEGFNHKVQVTAGVMREEAAQLMKSFFQQIRREKREAKRAEKK